MNGPLRAGSPASRVYLVLDDFAGDLWEFSRRHHVWIVDSPVNTPAARAVWARESSGPSPLVGVTTFQSCGDTLADFYTFVGTVDEHHDEASSAEPWTVIHVLGLSSENVSRSAVAVALGFDAFRLLASEGGFDIERCGEFTD